MTDDALMFTEQANKSFPPSKPYMYRFMFRVCEVSIRLTLLILLSSYLGALFLAIALSFDLICNIVLFYEVMLCYPMFCRKKIGICIFICFFYAVLCCVVCLCLRCKKTNRAFQHVICVSECRKKN